MPAHRMTPEDLANYQRILAGYPTISFTLLGFHLTATIGGLAGFFALMAGPVLTQHKAYWVSLLSALVAFVTLMLYLMWLREHMLKDQAVEDLKASGLRFPEPTRPWYAGLVTAMHTGFYAGALALWIALFLLAVGNPQWLLGKFS
jgi:hypothetical protein